MGFKQLGINAAITDWKEFTMAITGSTTNPVKATTPDIDKAYYRRVGDSAEIMYTYRQSAITGASSGSGTYFFSLPTGLSIDASKTQNGSLSSANRTSVGHGYILANTDIATSLAVASVLIQDSGSVFVQYVNDGEIGTLSSANGGFAGNSDLRIGLKFTVPISGWSA